MSSLSDPAKIREDCKEGDLVLFHFEGGGLMPGFYHPNTESTDGYVVIDSMQANQTTELKGKISGYQFMPRENGESFFPAINRRKARLIGYEVLRRAS